jgi:photosystem II stability/assembly factor-like uncharacterized protein
MLTQQRLFLGIFVLLILSSNANSQWINRTVSNVVHTYRTVYMVDSLTGWIGGSEGSILKTTDGGSSWISQYSDSGQTQILQIRFVDKFTGFAIIILKGVGAFLKTSNSGETWTIDSSLYKIAVDSAFVLSNLSITKSGDSLTISVLCWSYSGASGTIPRLCISQEITAGPGLNSGIIRSQNLLFLLLHLLPQQPYSY